MRSSAGTDGADVRADSSGEADIRRGYTAVRAMTRGPIAVLCIGDTTTRVACGDGDIPASVTTVAIGSRKMARAGVGRMPPTPGELEDAIMAVEDALAPLRAVIDVGATLWTSDRRVHAIARLAGVGGHVPMTLSREATEQTFERLAAASLGRPLSAVALPADADLAAALVIVREFLHHMAFTAITLYAE
jgi:exopolyphosphatase/pppGpp-phosphohydrolase